MYTKYDNIIFNNTSNITKHINNYCNDVTHNYNRNTMQNQRNTHCNFDDDITLNETRNNYPNDTYNIIKTNNTFNATDNQLFYKEIHNTSNITNNITRHNHNNYEHNVIKHVHTHIKHIHNYDTEINDYNRKSPNKKQYYNFYHDNFNFKKIEIISLTQQAGITNNIAETNNQTITYVDDNVLDNNSTATIDVNTIPGINENYLWIPETSDNVAPGLDSLLTYIQPKYATLTSLQNSIANINNTINNEMQTFQTEINNIETTPGTGNVSKESHYHTSHTDFMFKRNTTNNGNSRQFMIQNHYSIPTAI